MKPWKPKDKLIFLFAYDFEWVVDGEKQIPYAFGIYQEDPTKYIEHLSHVSIYQKFLDSIWDISREYTR